MLAIVRLGSVGGSSIVPMASRVEWHERTQRKVIMTLLGWCALQDDVWRRLRVTGTTSAAPRGVDQRAGTART
jgi:hypothetical protein